MIDFPCGRCHHPLSVPQELAGDDVQCPECGLLNSVPQEDEPVHPDGTLHVHPVNVADDPNRLSKLVNIFGTRSIDGEESDHRGDPDIIDLAPPIHSSKPIPLQYDPETGEVVTALEILPPLASPPPRGMSSSDMSAGTPALSYAIPGKTDDDLGSIWLRLFQPVNAAVLGVVFIAHFLYGIFYPFVVLMLGVLEEQGGPHIPAWLFNLIFWLVAAHYANVVEETGPEERDELPRPLRHMAFIDDIVAPLTRMLGAFLLCYTPAIIVLNLPINELSRVLALLLLVGGGMLFPAMLLTIAGSRAIANLRPDRVLRVITQSGRRYWFVAAISTIALPVYLYTLAAIDLITPLLVDTKALPIFNRFAVKSLITLPLAMAAIYAMHGVCWSLGRLIRERSRRFGWAWEEIEEQREEDRRKRREAQQRAATRRRQNAPPNQGQSAPPPKRLVMESLQSREHI